jgi:hypothetical protein
MCRLVFAHPQRIVVEGCGDGGLWGLTLGKESAGAADHFEFEVFRTTRSRFGARRPLSQLLIRSDEYQMPCLGDCQLAQDGAAMVYQAGINWFAPEI